VGVNVDAYSFTAGADYGIHAATMTEFSGGSIDMSIDVIASNGTTVLEADDEDGAIGSVSKTGDAIVVIVDVARECAAPEWSVIDGIGVFSGSFIINCSGNGQSREGELN
jgi:hypothetical protein